VIQGSMGTPKNTPERLRATWREKYAEVLGCHEWLGAVTSAGYGSVRFEGRNDGAHRVAYQLFVGPIPEGLVVRHKCDNKTCVNPAHLELGTPAENTQDILDSGGAIGAPKKLKDPRWRTVLKRLNDAGLPYASLGRMIGVSPQTIRRTITGRH